MNARALSTLFAANFLLVRLGLPHGLAALLLALLMFPLRTIVTTGQAADPSGIPLAQIGATVEKQYSGDGLSVCATASGARLRCVFQKIEGEVTHEGLWLSSTAEESKGERFRVVATAMGRVANEGSAAVCEAPAAASLSASARCGWVFDHSRAPLPSLGTVEVAGEVARFIRSGLTEEYRVSVEGVQQDFIITQRPGGPGQLRVDLAVAGARAEPLGNGARLVLEGSGRKLNYDRLRVTDATGKELSARMEVQSSADLQSIGFKGRRTGRGPCCFWENRREAGWPI